MSDLRYFTAYPESLQQQVQQLISGGQLKNYLLRKYPVPHQISSDRALFHYANELKQGYLKNAPAIAKAGYKKQKDMTLNALGSHSFVSRNHGGKLKSKHEIAISHSLKRAPEPLLRMLVVHELAHFREKNHNKAFYQLCQYMEPDYHQLELDMRLYLTQLELEGNIY